MYTRNVRTMPLEWSPINPRVLFYAQNAVYRTSDGGASWTRRDIPGLKDRPQRYFHCYLSRDGRLLTVTNDFYGLNESFVFKRK